MGGVAGPIDHTWGVGDARKLQQQQQQQVLVVAVKAS
jgi:hypothetical protein